MSQEILFQILRVYLECALLLGVVSGLLGCAVRVLRSGQALRLAHLLVLAALILPLGGELLPRSSLSRPSVQVWSRLDRKGRTESTWLEPTSVKYAALSRVQAPKLLLEKTVLATCLMLVAALMLARLARILWDVARLDRELKRLPLFRKQGRAEIRISDADLTPFSVLLPGSAAVVIPSSWIGTEDFQVALRHELQHHRQGDTSWLYLYEILKALFFLHPTMRLLSRQVEELQELACDEALLGQQRVSPQAYGRSLLRAAESAVGRRDMRFGTASMASRSGRQFLKRRIEMLFTQRGRKTSLIATLALTALSALTLATVAYAAKSAIQDRRITMGEAQALVSKSEFGEIPIEVNDLVLARLNEFVGSPKGREFMREGLRRMPLYQALIERRARDYGVPKELIAAALYESGFDNSRISTMRAAGIWQFIPDTARNYGLIVDERRDERFDPVLETEAAMKLLRDLHGLFKDWRLALMGYNVGEVRVQKLIDELGTRDAWALERAYPRERYLSGVIAALIIMKNPSLVD